LILKSLTIKYSWPADTSQVHSLIMTQRGVPKRHPDSPLIQIRKDTQTHTLRSRGIAVRADYGAIRLAVHLAMLVVTQLYPTTGRARIGHLATDLTQHEVIVPDLTRREVT